MLHPAKARIDRSTIERAVSNVLRELKRRSRPAGGFDAARYFRGGDDLAFYNVGTPAMRALARSICDAHRGDWSIDDAMACADRLIVERHLEAKSVGIEVVARYHRDFTPALLPRWKAWLARNDAANWATTDAICGMLIGPLLMKYPALAPRMRSWARDRNTWVRRAAAVSLIPSVRRAAALDICYDVALQLHGDREDLIQKAVGWMLREAGKRDQPRLERHLRTNGPSIPRTTVRYAIERFPPRTRQKLLTATRHVS